LGPNDKMAELGVVPGSCGLAYSRHWTARKH